MAPVVEIAGRPSAAKTKRRKNVHWNVILVIIAFAAIATSGLSMWHQTKALVSLQHHNEKLTSKSSQPSSKSSRSASPINEPIRFISVAGLYHSGTTQMWDAINSNLGVAAEKGIELNAYGTNNGGYPPCGIPLLADSTVDMGVAGNSSGICVEQPTNFNYEWKKWQADPNAHLFARYGTMWGDWHKSGPHSAQGVLNMQPPHKREEFYTLWKHTPPQHPVLSCFRTDTLYVIMVRHPKTWHKSMNKALYDFKYDSNQKRWTIYRNNPRRMPALEIHFRTLYNAWEFYMNGYLSWEQLSAGKNCHASLDMEGRSNCLGGSNEIPYNKRNILIVRYEDYLMSPKTVLAQIFSFATRGLIDAKTDEYKFVPYKSEKVEFMKEMLKEMKESGFFSVNSTEWDGATEIRKLCTSLGYSCDESSELFVH